MLDLWFGIGKKNPTKRSESFAGANPVSFFTNDKKTQCKVCQKQVSTNTAKIYHNFSGEHVDICSKKCANKLTDEWHGCGCGG